MAEIRDWQEMKQSFTRMLEERTGEGLNSWNERARREGFGDERSLRDWLTRQGVTGYPQTLLVWEQFGYPDWMQASANDLIEGQYASGPQLKPIFDAIMAAAAGLGEMTIQARKNFVSLVTPRRTFARVQVASKSRVDLCLRLEGQQPGGRLLPSKAHEHMPVQISLTSPEEVDAEVTGWMQKAYDENR